MKIPDNTYATIINNHIEVWKIAASEISLKYGIFVKVDYDSGTNNISRIYFEIDNNQFESLNDLNKALENKAFL